eukprot:SAG11_NODE_291_length_11180_cov_102.040155_17_plen_75_part_00
MHLFAWSMSTKDITCLNSLNKSLKPIAIVFLYYYYLIQLIIPQKKLSNFLSAFDSLVFFNINYSLLKTHIITIF